MSYRRYNELSIIYVFFLYGQKKINLSSGYKVYKYSKLKNNNKTSDVCFHVGAKNGRTCFKKA